MSDDLAITPAGPADAPAAVTLLLAQYADHQIPVTPEGVAAGVARMLADPDAGVILLARRARDGAVVAVAYVAYGWVLECCGEVAFLEELFVVPEERAHGVGSALIDAVRARAVERGCLALDLEVVDGRDHLARLYTRHGFARLPRTHWTLRLKPGVR